MADRIIAQRYVLEKQLGAGGMGTVYQGVDRHIGQIIAIKQLKSELAQPDMLERFRREGEALRDLNHPSIVKMLDAVEQDGQHYLIMEYLPGGDLTTLLHKGRLPLKQTLDIALDLADALTRAHRLNIIHRDLKPGNILIAEDGTPRLTDFGVAHFGERERVTVTGAAVGTLDYISPEALNGSDADVRSDIWSFGVILFEMLAGQRPFTGDKVSHLITQILTAPVPDLEALCPDAPVALVDLVYRMLAKIPGDRIPSVRLVGAELEALLHNTPLPARPVGLRDEAVQTSAFASTPAAASITPHNLPNQTTAFVGREAELETLRQVFMNPSNQLVTIFAPGGMGKTRLSIAAAESLLAQFPQGVFFVELAPLESSGAIPMAVADALGYPFQEDGRSSQQQLVDYFRDKAQFLILDNFEHVIDGRDFVHALLQAAPQLKILVTSRIRLNLSSETVFQLEGMEFPEWETPADATRYAAIRLFLESAQRVRPGFVFSAEDLPYAARICRLVHGLPLALVLAGTWLELLSVREIAQEIETSIDFLETTLHDIPERQRTMRAVFEYSWRLLTDDERAVFARLSVFRGGMTRDSAQAVGSANLRVLQSLANKSILRRNNTTGRCDIHELLRQYAQEYLTQIGSLADTLQQHTGYFAAFLSARTADMKGQRQIEALHEIEADFENVKSAWRYACEQHNESAVDSILEPLYWFCIFRSRNMEGMELFQVARQRWPVSDSAPLLAGRLLVRYPDYQPDLTATYETGLALARQYADQHEIAFCLRQLGHWLSHSLLRQDTGMPILQESLGLYRALGDRFYEAIVLDDLGWSYNLIADVPQHLHHVKQCLEIRRQLGDKIGVTNALRNLGGASGGFSSPAHEPRQYWQEALQLALEINDRTSIAWNYYLLSAYDQYLGEFEAARRLRDSARQVAHQINDRVILGLCTLGDALELAFLHEDYDQAERMSAEACPPNAPADLRLLVNQLNQIYFVCARGDEAQIKACIGSLSTIGLSKHFTANLVLAGLTLCTVQAKYELAADLLGVLRQEPPNAVFLMTRRWVWFQRLQAQIEHELGTEAFQMALRRGRERDLSETAKAIYAQAS